MTNRAVALICAIALTTARAFAQSPAPDRDPIEPDRPDLTNGPHLLAAGAIQLEIGGLYTRVSHELTGLAAPVLARFGVSNRIEARIGADGWVAQTEESGRQSGFGNIQAGAKVRLLDDSHGATILSLLPAVNLPTASARQGLGSGDADYTLAILAGADVGARGHVDANYGIGKIGAGGGQPHFTQHLVSVSASISATDRWDPYAEVFWLSRQDPGGGAIAAFDVGAICHLRDRLALDGGMQVGLNQLAPHLAVFGGLSVGLRRSKQ